MMGELLSITSQGVFKEVHAGNADISLINVYYAHT